MARPDKDTVRAAFDEGLLACADSAAFLAFCRAVNGWDRFTFSMVDAPQRALVKEACALRPGHRLLDLGCATGELTAFLAEGTGATALGIDFAPSLIQRARRDHPDLSFAEMDLDALELPAHSVDVAVAIDTLYFAADLERTIGAVWEALRPGGRLVATWSATGSPGQGLTLPETRLGRALAAHPGSLVSTDLTADAARVWRASRRALDDLREIFEAEGSVQLWEERCAEVDVQLARVESGVRHRWLVVKTR